MPPRALCRQGNCGSCWAFSGVGAIESNLLLDGQNETSLSEQLFVDCAPNPDSCGGSGGCAGATQPLLFEYAMTSGCASEEDYAYVASTGTCEVNAYNTVATIEGYGILPENCDEATLKVAPRSSYRPRPRGEESLLPEGACVGGIASRR